MGKGRVYGQSCTGLLAKYDPDTHSLKMFQPSLFGEEPESLQTLPKSGMTRNGRLWEQTMWVHPTAENESGLWPTPSATPRGAHTGAIAGSVAEDGKSRISANGTKWGATLETAVKMFPTPTANDHKGWSPNHKRANDPTNRLDFRVEPETGVGGTLNPTWVEWLMGYPIGWTDLED